MIHFPVHARSLAFIVAVALAATGVAAPRAIVAAPPAPAAPLAPWEREVERETAAQNTLIDQAKVTKSIQSIVSKYENRVFRDPTALNEYLLGRALYHAANPTAAKGAMERCLAADPKFHYAHSRLAILLHELKNDSDAEAHLRQVLAAKPGQPDALALLSQIAIERKEWAAAIGWLNQRLSADPSDLIARQNLALVYVQSKDWPAARRELRILVDRDPTNLVYRYMTAVVLIEVNEVDGAIPLLESVIREQPGQLEALARLHRAYRLKEDWKRVRSTLERMLPYLDEETRKKATADIEQLKIGPPAKGSPAPAKEFSWDDVLRVVEDDPNATRREDALIAIYDGCVAGELKQVSSKVLRRVAPAVESSDSARSIVVKILSTISPEQALPLLLLALYDPSERVRMLAEEAIGATKKPIGLAYLFPFLATDGMSVSEYQSARWALSEITGFKDLPVGTRSVTTPDDVTASREAWRRWRLSDSSDEIKRAAIRQLLDFREQNAERYLYDFVLDPSFDVMSEAYKAMREALSRAPNDPVETKTFPRFPRVSDLEVTRANMRPLQDRVVTWWMDFVSERRAYLQAQRPSTPVPSTPK